MNEEELKLLDKIEELPRELDIEIRGLILSEVCLREENQQLKEKLEVSEKTRKEINNIIENKFLESTLESYVCLKVEDYLRLKDILDIDKGE